MDEEDILLEQRFIDATRAVLSVHLEMGAVLGLKEEDIYSRLEEISTGAVGEDGFALMEGIHESWSSETEPKLQIFMVSARANFRQIMAMTREFGLNDVDYVLQLLTKEFENIFDHRHPEKWPTYPAPNLAFPE